MTQQEVLIKKMSQGYKNAIIEELRKTRGMDDALTLFGRYYRPVKKVWGHEPNAEEFAQHILRLDRWAHYRPQAGHGVSIAHIKPLIRKRQDESVQVAYSYRGVPRIAITKKRSVPHRQHALNER